MPALERPIELLSPARDYAAGRDAVDFGADAVYIGGPRFGARHTAGNSVAEIARLVEYAHPFGVRVYAALNTLIFEDELHEAERTARELIAAGVDALIIQDMAFLRMDLPPVSFHASTQTCNATPEHVLFLEKCGFSRVILERGLTLDGIRAIRAATTVPLECFVHGAVCVGFSGQCYLSRTQSPRSGNRGDCIQACRQTYDLTDGSGKTILAGKHLLSVRDLNLTDRLDALVDAGVDSFKIEGRLKDKVYIRNVVAHYRRELDRIIAARPGLRRSSSGATELDFTPDPAKSFTRGFTHYFFDGPHRNTDEKRASFDTPKAIGIPVGRVVRAGRDHFTIDRSAVAADRSLAAGDGICFQRGGTLIGTNVNRADGATVYPNKMTGIEPGLTVYRNYDHAFTTAVEKSRTRRTIGVEARLEILPDAPDGNCRIVLRVEDEDGHAASSERAGTFPPADNPARMESAMRTQLAKSGDTIFRIDRVSVPAAGLPFVPASLLNELRREALAHLLHARSAHPPESSPAREDRDYPYPADRLDGTANVANPLAERFYREHGVHAIEPAFDLRDSLPGERVMVSSYCLRREIGQCLRDGKPVSSDPLYLRRGRNTYRLAFDCERCRMSLYDESSKPHIP